MRIVGQWRVCDDGVTRPTIVAKVQANDGTYHVDVFLVDSCADRTVFSDNLGPMPKSGDQERVVGYDS